MIVVPCGRLSIPLHYISVFTTLPIIHLSDKIREYTDNRRGLICRVPSLIRRTTQQLNTIRDGMFGIQGPKLFNFLTGELCAREDTEDPQLLEKLKKNTFLATIPDEPRLPSYPSVQRNNSNTTQVGRVRDDRGGSN